MMMTEIFEQAARLKLRFGSPKGALTVEDLYDLPLSSQSGRANLDDIAKALNRQLKVAVDEVSFVAPAAPKANDELELQFAVVKRIIEVRVAERDAAKARQEKAEKKQRIMELIARKRDEALSETSVEDLEKMLAEV
jgi:hypothetical protein